MTGWNLPPGCNVSDIPGNSPEDEKWEAILNVFWEKIRTPELDKAVTDASDEVCNLLNEAIEYGIEVGTNQANFAAEENKYYEAERHEEVRNPKLRAFFKNQRKAMNLYLAALETQGLKIS